MVRKLWSDDTGAVLSTEYVLLSGVLVTGVVPGLVAARNSINASYANMGNRLTAAIPEVEYNGYQIGGMNGNPIASAGGVAIRPASQPQYLQAQQLLPTP
jgi:Flp pilus assembly pilin Flp